MKRANDECTTSDSLNRKRPKTDVSIDIQPSTFKPNLSEVQNLILRVFTSEYGENVRWLTVRGMNHVRNAVIVLVPCLDSRTLRQQGEAAPVFVKLLQGPGAIAMRSSRDVQGIVDHFPKDQGPISVAASVMRSLLSAKGKPSVKKKVPKTSSSNGKQLGTEACGTDGKPPLCSYLATREERERSGYPSKTLLGPDWVSTRTSGAEMVATNASGTMDALCAPSKELPRDVDRDQLVAMDCEMVMTASGPALARVSVVGPDGTALCDELVKPEEEVTDYLTPFSGITADKLKDVKTTLKDIQEKLLGIISVDSVLVGHSLENDLQALRLVHERVVDTALIYPHPQGWPYRNGLSYLVSKFLNRKLDRAAGHDSIVDARASLDLALLKFDKGINFGLAAGNQVPLSRLLIPSGVQLSLSDHLGHSQYGSSASAWLLEGCTLGVDGYGNGDAARSQTKRQREVQVVVLRDFEVLCESMVAAVASSGPPQSPSSSSSAVTSCVECLDAQLRKIVDSLAPEDLLIVMNGAGDLHRLRALEARTGTGEEEKSEAEKRELKHARSAFNDAFGVFMAGAAAAALLAADAAVAGPLAPSHRVPSAPPRRELVTYDL